MDWCCCRFLSASVWSHVDSASPRVRAVAVYLIFAVKPNRALTNGLGRNKMTAMATIEVKTEDQNTTLPNLEALVDAVRSGKLGKASLVRLSPESDWVPANSLPEVAALFVDDVWSAWDGDEDASVLDAFQVPESTRPKASLEPAATIPPVDEVADLPEAAVTPVDDVPTKAKPETRISDQPITPASTTHPAAPSMPRRPAAKVIAFPQPEAVRTDGATALKRQPSPFESQSQPAVRWGRIAILGAVAAAATLLWVWYVNMHATADFAPPTRATAVPSVASIPPPMNAEQIDVEVSPYETLEDELREQLMEGLLDIPGEGEFEDALLIELRRVRVDVRSIRVKVLSWAGRRQDLPDEVTFNFKVVAREGELDRDLGALGLVMGKYIQHYGLQAVELNIILSSEDGLRKIVMDPEIARRYFTHRVSLERFLKSAFSGAE